ncbi:hypothetical protein [Malonomonas rubra]|uniref:hypothetical protein n=1 Tax=Malonomonas rubra TaxID=57040 RepID=UPI0026F36997|nr:hypothetical protein [Malonomonas rubra]
MVEFLLAILTLFASQAQALDRRVPIHICHAQQLVLKIKTVETLQKTDQFNAAGHYAGTMKNLTKALKTQLRYSLNS